MAGADMRRALLIGVLCSATLLANRADAWWDEGHMQVAAVAYSRLTPAVRAKVDALIKLNPQYQSWIHGWPADKVAEYAFVRASTWADDIKKPEMGYINDGNKSNGPDARRNIGYYDHLMHKYWHYKDIGFSTDGTQVEDPDPVNAVTQIKKLTAGLSPSSGLPDNVRSYDLVWLIHLVGDAHQPLHATSRFSHRHTHGDEGGNKDSVIPATGETIALHAYWDRLLGGSSTPEGAIDDALVYKSSKLPEPDTTLANENDPDVWFAESEKLAEQFSYAEPVMSGIPPYMLTRDYETSARNVARKQAALGGARLANLLNDVLK
jgi:hypothetical protein